MKMRRTALSVLFSIFISFAPGLSLFAQDDSAQGPQSQVAPSSPNQYTHMISLSLRNIDIIEALKFFSMKSGFNIVPTQKVSGRITLNVENVPDKDVFDIMLRSNSLAYDKKNDIYNVMTEQEYKVLFGKNFFDTRQVKIFRLKYAIPEQAYGLLDALKSDIGRLIVEPEPGAVMMIDTPDKIVDAEKALEALEQKNAVKVFNLKYAKAKDVEEQLKSQLDLKKVGMVKSDDRTNQVIVQTLPERMKNIEELVASLDKKTKAVLIDVKIIKITLSNQNDTGVQWEGLFNLAQKYGTSYLGSYPFSAVQAATAAWRSRSQVLSDMNGNIGSYPFSGTTSNFSGGGKTTAGQAMHVGLISGKQDFDAVINYLQTIGKSKIIATPSMSVVNNQEAKIHIGERRAYVTTTTTTGTTTSTVSEEVTFVDVGVSLSVIPMINDDGYITMKVKPEISSVVSTIVSSSNNVVPIIDTSTAETTVIAKDGSTVLIAGLGREEKTESTEQTPILGKIPLLGFLFRNKTEATQRVELVIMLTPTIFEGDKFITTEDTNKFPVKPKKQFDVFRPEIFIPLDGDMNSKNFKSYNRPVGSVPEIPAQQQAPKITPLNEQLTPKGMRSYN